jgi:predicted nicotinamide N-methyase
VGRLLGAALRTAAGSRRRPGRPVRAALIEEQFEVAGRTLTLLRPPSADELIDETLFEAEEFLPYWAELWPSGVALAAHVARRDLHGLRVLELGAGLGLPSLAAALRGADVLATDWAEDAVALLRANAARNHVALRAELVR